MIEEIWNFLERNITPATIIAGYVISKISSLFDKTAVFGFKLTYRFAKKTNVKNATKIIKNLEDRLYTVEKLKNKDFDTLVEIDNRIYQNLILMIVLIGVYLLIESINPDLENAFYFVTYVSFMTLGSSYLFGSLMRVIYNRGLIVKARNFEKYKSKIERKINYWQGIKDYNQK